MGENVSCGDRIPSAPELFCFVPWNNDHPSDTLHMYVAWNDIDLYITHTQTQISYLMNLVL